MIDPGINDPCRCLQAGIICRAAAAIRASDGSAHRVPSPSAGHCRQVTVPFHQAHSATVSVVAAVFFLSGQAGAAMTAQQPRLRHQGAVFNFRIDLLADFITRELTVFGIGQHSDSWVMFTNLSPVLFRSRHTSCFRDRGDQNFQTRLPSARPAPLSSQHKTAGHLRLGSFVWHHWRRRQGQDGGTAPTAAPQAYHHREAA